MSFTVLPVTPLDLPAYQRGCRVKNGFFRIDYATQKATEGEVPLASLAKYMGTSISMFEQHYIQMNPEIFRDEVASTGLPKVWEKQELDRIANERAERKETEQKERDAKLDAILNA